MAVVSETGQKIPLGVGKILGNSFLILFGNVFKILALVAVAAFVHSVFKVFVFGFAAPAMWSELVSTGPGRRIGDLASFLIGPIIYGLMIGFIVCLAYDAKLNGSRSFAVYFRSSIPAIIPVIIISLVPVVLAQVNAIAMLVSFALISVVCFMIASVAVIERAGLSSVSRSADLTKGYRWPIAGSYIVVLIFAALVARVLDFATLMLSLKFSLTSWRNTYAFLVLDLQRSLTVGLIYAYGGIVTTLIYARLREIKEGGNFDHVGTVFD